MVPLARDIGRPISLALVQNLAYPDVWREALRAGRGRPARSGARIVPQVAVRSVGILIGFGIAINPLTLFPAAADLLGLPRRRAAARAARSGRARPRCCASIARRTAATSSAAWRRLEHVFPLDGDGVRAYETTPDRSVVAMARAARQARRSR